jgi:hypothetical protein
LFLFIKISLLKIKSTIKKIGIKHIELYGSKLFQFMGAGGENLTDGQTTVGL